MDFPNQQKVFFFVEHDKKMPECEKHIFTLHKA